MVSARDVLFIHGAGGGAWQWRDWTPVFEQAGYTPHLAELQPAAGGLEHTHFEDYVAQLREQVAALMHPVLIGASLGGLLALELAQATEPCALVLVNSLPPAHTPAWSPARRYPPLIEWSRTTRLPDTREAMPESDEATIRWAHAHWRDESGAVLNAAYRGIEIEPPGVPVLVLCGAQDRTVPLQVCRQIAEGLKADSLTFDTVSHVGALLGPQAARLARAALQWLSDTPGE